MSIQIAFSHLGFVRVGAEDCEAKSVVISCENEQVLTDIQATVEHHQDHLRSYPAPPSHPLAKLETVSSSVFRNPESEAIIGLQIVVPGHAVALSHPEDSKIPEWKLDVPAGEPVNLFLLHY
ncbi:hypothetical protein [Ferrimonas marina]|uniref:Uncharacterized protein n=1 Tax=Ferrimonas marina TaxID=299255 RepID=A0A1M5T6S4_9GAMM|nr:hypothetical protein [Ferrimonas marina]SHH46467.1 hypothetical protein SAMN02745129_2024 [Ferrimonas marina]